MIADRGRAAIEDDQGAGIQAKAVQVIVKLAQAILQRIAVALAPDLELWMAWGCCRRPRCLPADLFARQPGTRIAAGTGR